VTDTSDPLLIRGGRVLRNVSRPCEPTDVLVANGRIVAVEPPGVIEAADRRVIDATDRLLIPGLVNGHTHGHGALGKGLVEDRAPLEVFLSASGTISASRTIADKRLTAQLTAVELIRKGCTACYDLFVEIPAPSREGLEAVASAYREVGMRAVVAPMLSVRTTSATVVKAGVARNDRTAWRASRQSRSNQIVRTSRTASVVCVMPPRSRRAIRLASFRDTPRATCASISCST
jgi:cytosine/adenosine deaminase-related metal-dependent hydrolase